MWGQCQVMISQHVCGRFPPSRLQAKRKGITTSGRGGALRIGNQVIPRARRGLTTDSSSGGWSPCFSACPDKILRATGSFFPKNLSWMFCFDKSFFTGISCLRFGSQSHKKRAVGDVQERTGKGSRCHGCTPLWRRRNIDVADCVCNRVQCAPAA